MQPLALPGAGHGLWERRKMTVCTKNGVNVLTADAWQSPGTSGLLGTLILWHLRHAIWVIIMEHWKLFILQSVLLKRECLSPHFCPF